MEKRDQSRRRKSEDGHVIQCIRHIGRSSKTISKLGKNNGKTKETETHRHNKKFAHTGAPTLGKISQALKQLQVKINKLLIRYELRN